jgi:ribosomal protein L17
MVESSDLRQHIEHLVERTQDELLEASRQLAASISRGTERLVPPAGRDIEKLVDEVFEFADRVMKGQRKVVKETLRAMDEQARKMPGRTRGAAKLGPGRRSAPAAKSPAKRAPAGATAKTSGKKTTAGTGARAGAKRTAGAGGGAGRRT